MRKYFKEKNQKFNQVFFHAKFKTNENDIY